jgi:hypothetical protein
MTVLDQTERLGHAHEFCCDDCGRPLDQLGSLCVGCAADRLADQTYARASDR